ncbi:hypothetical protein ACHAXT_006784 [Thalassiosira profunda]
MAEGEESRDAPAGASSGGAASPKPDDPLLAGIKAVVGATNSALAALELATADSSTMLVSRLQAIGKQARYIATRAMTTYEHRGQYGPQIIAGSVATVGGIVALRRGKVTGALAGGLAGAAAYGGIYGYEDYSATSWRSALPKKEG